MSNENEQPDGIPELPEIFWEVHSNLPQEGPGDDESTIRALKAIKDLPDNPNILDIGCGPGRQTMALAGATNGSITCLDFHQPFLDDVRRKAEAAGFSDRISTVRQSMTEIELPEESFDLIWSEGAIYIMGFEAGLSAWKRLLKPGGAIAVTEVAWLKSDRPKEVEDFWIEAYPAIGEANDNLGVVEGCGYEVVGHFPLPPESWENYYGPMAGRIVQLREKYAGHAAAQAHLDEEQREIEIFRHYSDYYSYVFYVMRLPS